MARPKGAKTVNRTPGVKLGRPLSDNPKPTRVKGIKKTRPLKSPSEERGHSPFVALGQVINPAGRPKRGESLTEMLRVRMSEFTADGRKQYKEAVVDRVLSIVFAAAPKTEDGKIDKRLDLEVKRLAMDATKWVFDRVDGKAVQPVENTLQGPNGGPVEVKSVATDEELDALLVAMAPPLEAAPPDV